MVYASGGKGSNRFFFVHGNHECDFPSGEVFVTATIVVFDRQRNRIFGDMEKPVQYCFIDGVYQPKDELCIPDSDFTTKMMKNVSIPTLVVAEIDSTDSGIVSDDLADGDKFLYMTILVSERTDHPCRSYDKYYLDTMMRGFIPYFNAAISTKSENYLPGDVENLSKEIFNDMKLEEHDENLMEFLEQYRKRYFGNNQKVQVATILHSCLLSILKMPFNLTSSMEQGLMTC